MREKQGVNKKDNLSENGMDKGNKKSTCETLQAMFEGMIVSQPVDKLKTQVKGYSVTMITERMLKKNKLGDVIAEICDMTELERESAKVWKRDSLCMVSSETSRCGAALSLIKKILPGVS